jgi:hypothetical protein
MGARDEFSAEIKRALAGRVGLLCSNPECRASTAGPQSDPVKVVNIGVAAHITAAASGGPRFDSAITPEERASATNGLWLCQNCAKRIDSDVARYPAELLKAWKLVAESLADSALGRPGGVTAPVTLPSSPKDQAVAAIAAKAANAESVVRLFTESLATRLAEVSATLQTVDRPTFEQFSTGVDAAKPLVQDFCEVAAIVAEFNPALVTRLFRGFEGIFALYDSSAPGSRWTTSFDIAKFVGHELFLVFVAVMIRFEQWDALGSALGQSLFGYLLGERRPITYSQLLADIQLAKAVDPRQQWFSAHGEVLRRRYESPMPVSFAELVAADYLVHIVTGIGARGGGFWYPVTIAYMKDTPDWLSRCQSAEYLTRMLAMFGVKEIEEFRQNFAKIRLPNFPMAFHLDFYLLKPERLATCR